MGRIRMSALRLFALILVSACSSYAPQQARAQKEPTVTKAAFGRTPEGVETTLFTCKNSNGLSMQLTDYGARLVSLWVPDAGGQLANVTLGFNSLDKYLAH